MKKSRFGGEQIMGILKQHAAGVRTVELCREHGSSAATFYQVEVEVRRHVRGGGTAAE